MASDWGGEHAKKQGADCFEGDTGGAEAAVELGPVVEAADGEKFPIHSDAWVSERDADLKAPSPAQRHRDVEGRGLRGVEEDGGVRRLGRKGWRLHLAGGLDQREEVFEGGRLRHEEHTPGPH